MDRKLKSLLLGIHIRWETASDGSQILRQDQEFEKAFDRVIIHYENLESDTLKSFIDAAEVINWLVEHPKAEVHLGYWCVEIVSPEFEDVDYEKHDDPFSIGGAVEDFKKSKREDGWFCSWSVA